MNLFYQPDLGSSDLIELSDGESGHAIRVLRLKTDDPVVIVDGKGTWIEGTIAKSHPKKCIVIAKKRIGDYGKPADHLHIAIAPTKQIDRFEWFLEKATEIGVSEITPLLCDHSERKEVKTERMLRVVIAAMKQSLKAFHPKINDIIPFRELISGYSSTARFIAHCSESQRTPLWEVISPGTSSLVLIGPEGDFSPDEISLASVEGFLPVMLGNSRLRTETAGVVTCHTFALKNNR